MIDDYTPAIHKANKKFPKFPKFKGLPIAVF